MIFIEYIYSFFRRLGIFSISWQEAVFIVISVAILILSFMKLLPIRTAVPFAVGMMISNLAEGFSALPALSLNSELISLLILLFFIGKGAETDVSWIIRKPSLLIFSITAQMGFFLILAAPFLYAGSDLPKTNTIPVMIFIYTSLMPVIQEPVTMLTAGKPCAVSREILSPDMSYGKHLSALILLIIVSGLIVPAALPFTGLYLLGCALRFPKLSSILELILWLCMGLSSHFSVICHGSLVRLMALGLLALITSGLFSGIAGRLISKLTDGRLHPQYLKEPINAASYIGVLTGAGVLLTICC